MLFTEAGFPKIFGSADFKSQRKARPERYRIILICPFGGCRSEEAAQLYLSDVKTHNGIYYFNVTDEVPDQNLKTGETNKRRLTIHSGLIQLGLVGYVEALRANGETRLFPSLRKGYNGFGDAVGKGFNRLLSGVGFTDAALFSQSETWSHHKLHSVGVVDNVVRLLVGHTKWDVHHTMYVQKDLIPITLS